MYKLFALCTALRNPEHRMQTLVAVGGNSQCSLFFQRFGSSGLEKDGFQTWRKHVPGLLAEIHRRSQRFLVQLNLLFLHLQVLLRDQKAVKVAKIREDVAKVKANLNNGHKGFEYLMKHPSGISSKLSRTIPQEGDLLQFPEEVVLPWELQVGAHLRRLRRTETLRRLPVSLWQGPLNRESRVF